MKLTVLVTAGGWMSSQAAFAAGLQQCCSSAAAHALQPALSSQRPAAPGGSQSHRMWAAELKDTRAEMWRAVEAEAEQ